MEAIAFEYKGYLAVMRSTGCIDRLKAVRCVGGGARSAVFCRIKADVLGADYHAAGALRSAPQTMALLAAYATDHTERNLAGLFACPEDAAPSATIPPAMRRMKSNTAGTPGCWRPISGIKRRMSDDPR